MVLLLLSLLELVNGNTDKTFPQRRRIDVNSLSLYTSSQSPSRSHYSNIHVKSGNRTRTE